MTNRMSHIKYCATLSVHARTISLNHTYCCVRGLKWLLHGNISGRRM